MEILSSIEAWESSVQSVPQSEGKKISLDIKKYYLDHPQEFYKVNREYQIMFLAVFKDDPEVMMMFPYHQVLQNMMNIINTNPKLFNKWCDHIAFIDELIYPPDRNWAYKILLDDICANRHILDRYPPLSDTIQNKLLQQVGIIENIEIYYRQLFPNSNSNLKRSQQYDTDVPKSKKSCLID